jgi:predicted ArsR family transcriptional regulator
MTTKQARKSIRPPPEGRRTPDAVSALALLDEPTRRALYEFVVTSDHAVGRDEAATALGISRELASFHLDRLAAGGLLQTSFRRLSGRTGPGAGRPAKLYTRADREIAVSLPARNYDTVADAFAGGLERLAEQLGRETVTGAIDATARELGSKLAAGVRGMAGRSRSQRREHLVQLLRNGGFEPAIDPASGAVTLRNCPYRALSESHRELTCGMNLAWAEGVTETVGETSLTPTLAPAAGRCCVVFSPESKAG